MSIFSLQRCTDVNKWNEFVSASPQGTRYCTQEMISSLGCEADFWFVIRKGYPVAGVPVITNNLASVGLPMHSYYVSIMFHPEAWNCKANRRTENIMSITEVVMEELSTHYDEIQLCLHPDITDVRGFDWFNYHTPEQGRVSLSPRYTAQIKLDGKHIRELARGSRRREESYALSRENLQFAIDGTVDELIELWQQSFARQGNTLSDMELSVTKQFAQHVLQHDYGVIAATRDETGKAQTAGLMLFDFNSTVHLPVVGTAETRYGGTLLYFSMMDYAAAQGYEVMDFNGANSPKRAYFKHSIGGGTILYFSINWKKPV